MTSDCNNKCLHCYNFWKYNSNIKRSALSIEEWCEVARILGENDIFYVTVTGGEPFLEKDKTYKFMKSLCEHNIRIMINSNATLITDEDAKRLLDYSVEIFLVSLISFNEKIHNIIVNSDTAFKKTISGINLLQK